MRRLRRPPLVVIVISALLLALCVYRVAETARRPANEQAAGETLPSPAAGGQANATMAVEVLNKPAPTTAPAAAAAAADYAEPVIAVYDAALKRVADMPLEAYLTGVVAAEMPATYPLEALKAQAVAARTYTLHKTPAYGGAGCSKHKGADICTDSSHCQAYADETERKKRWGQSFAANEALMTRAVNETRGLVVTYGGKPILALFHANSGGRTEDAQAAFSQSVPYLVSVDSAGEESEKHYTDTATYTAKAFAKLVNAAYPKAKLTAAELSKQVAVTKHTASGRVDTLKLGGVTITGRQARALLNLYSAYFTVSMGKNGVTITSKGYGHGVGLSQAGARAQAEGGAVFEAILKHYYTGTEVEPLK